MDLFMCWEYPNQTFSRSSSLPINDDELSDVTYPACLSPLYLICKTLPSEAKDCLEDWGRSICFHLLICSVLFVFFILPVYLARSRHEFDCALLNSRHCLKLFQQHLAKTLFLSSFVSLKKRGGLGQRLPPESYFGTNWLLSEGEIVSSSWSGAEDVEKSVNKKSCKHTMSQPKWFCFLLLLSHQHIFKLQSDAWNRNLFKLDPYPNVLSVFDLVIVLCLEIYHNWFYFAIYFYL